ncbi:MAG: tetratricopeptide repeat protein [Candidatus Hinthialibacter antarcticus]|nr:tetratricopeptide repeat protein [Candidatus Hinthialibacter antarcticus]
MAAGPMDGSKTALELALELGVRSETILRAMKSAGYDVDDPMTEVDSLLEQRLVEVMVDNGELPQSMISGKGRRQLTDDPIVDDEAVTQALGASSAGFSESNIPRQITLESSFDKPPSLFSRMFSKAKNLARTLKNSEYTPDELNTFFSTSVPKETKSRSPFEQQEEPEPASEQDDLSAPELDAIDDYMPDEDEVSDDGLEGMDTLQESGLEDMALDPDMMEDLEGVDLEDASLDDDLAGLSEELGLDAADLEGVADDIDDIDDAADELTEGLEDEMEGVELDEEDLELLDGEEGGAGGAGDGDVISEEEEEYVPNFLEKILSRIHLSPSETWALIGGAFSLMIIVLVCVVAWWMWFSPKAQKDIYDQAVAHQESARDIVTEYDYLSAERWKERAGELEAASVKFETYITEFPETPLTKDAYYNWCDITFELANLYEENAGEEDTDPIAKKSEEAYRQTTQRYNTYLDYLQKIANRAVSQGVAGEDQFVPVEYQQEALWRIALSQQKLKRYQEAIDQFDQFAQRFSTSPESVEAIQKIADIYQEWAKTDKEEELNMLNEATERYKQALERLETKPDENRLALSQIHAELGDIQYRLYERSQEQEKNEQADAFLRESIGHYEAAENEARLVTNLSNAQRNEIFKPLADMYLMRGRAAGELWNRNEEGAQSFPEGITYRQTLLDEAARQRELAQDFLGKANTLYDEMISTDNKELKEDIIYNKTEALFIMRKYPEAMAAGQILLGESEDTENTTKLSPDVDAKLHYLLGHVAWEMAKKNKDYTNVKKYYREALAKDAFFPKERQGEISHLATLRLTNAYFLVDKNYEESLNRFQSAKENYPDTDYTFLTLYWMGKAQDEYGQHLNQQADDLLAKSQAQSDQLQAQQLREKAKQQYADAILTYDRAIESRELSKYIDVQNKSYLIEIMFNRGHSAFFAGKQRDAEKYLLEALDKHQNDAAAKKHVPETIERLGDINALLANYDKAIDYYRDYLGEAYPDPNARVKMKLADAYLRHFSPDRAREWYNRIVRDYGTPKGVKGPGFESLKKIARSHIQESALKSGQESDDELNNALGAFDSLAKNYPLPDNAKLPNDAESLHAIGNIQYRLNNYPESISAYKAYLRHANAPQRTGMIHYRIGQAYLDMNQPAQAVNELGNITEQSMDNLTQYADALILTGEAYEEQAKQYQQNGDNSMYETYLRKAEEAYNRVKITGSADRIAEADTKRKLIASILARLREQRELARNQQLQGG